MRRQLPSGIRARGFTVLEMIIVIVVVGVIFGLGAIVIGRAFESYDLARRATDIDWQGRVAMERIARELRRIRSNAASDLAFAPDLNSPNEIRFIDADGNPVCFRLAGDMVERSADGPSGTCGGTNPQPLADSIVTGGLDFGVYAQDGDPAASVTDIYYISVVLQVSQGGIDETFRVTVQPRRF